MFRKSKNHLRKFILTFQHYQTLSQRIFFEWIPGLEVSGEKKKGCVPCPIKKTCYDFYASTQKEIGIQVIRGFGALFSSLRDDEVLLFLNDLGIRLVITETRRMGTIHWICVDFFFA